MIEVKPTRYPPEFCGPGGALSFDRVARHYDALLRAEGPLDAFDGKWLAYLDACGSDPPAYSSARIYYALFDGLLTDDRITDAVLKVQIGGTEAALAGTRYRMSIYARKHIDGDNLALLDRQYIDLPDIGSVGLDEAWRYWRIDTIDAANIDVDPVSCVVLKVEQLSTETYVEQNEDYVPGGADQYRLADPPQWGVRLLEASIYASPLRRNVTPEAVVEHIVSPYWSGDRFWCPDTSGVECDQLVFESIPFTRLDALQQVDTLVDWDYEATKDRFTYRKPTTLGAARDDELYPVSLADPRFGTSITMAVDECFNGVRIKYSNVNDRPKELIRWTESETLGDTQRAKVEEMPDAIRSKKNAEHAADLFLASHKEPPIAGAPTFVQSATVASGEDRDCLLMKPGELVIVNDAPRTYRRQEREISRVTLRPLEHKADVELGAKSRRFDKWLARLDTKRSKE